MRGQVDMKFGASGGHDAVAAQEFEAMLMKLDSAQQEFHNGRPAMRSGGGGLSRGRQAAKQYRKILNDKWR